MFQCREAKAERGCVAVYKNVRGVNTREELLMLKDNIGMRTSANKLVMNKCRLWTTEGFVTMGGEELGLCFPKGALEQKQSWFSSAASFWFERTADPEVPSRAVITPRCPSTFSIRGSECKSTFFSCLLLLICSSGVGRWSWELRAPCGKGRLSTQGCVEVAVAGTNHAHVSSAHTCSPGAPHLHCLPISRDTEHLTWLIESHICNTDTQKATGRWIFSANTAAWAIILLGASVPDVLPPHTWNSRWRRCWLSTVREAADTEVPTLCVKGQRKPRRLKVSVCLTSSNMEHTLLMLKSMT